LVTSLILEEPPFLMFSNLTPDVAAVFQNVRRLADEQRFREAAEQFLRFAGSYRTGGTAFDKLDPTLRESMLENAATLLPELQAGTGEELTVEQLQRITCPVRFVLGELTPDAFVDCTERLTRILPQAGVTRIPGAAHAVHIDQPELFVDAVRSAVLARA